MEQGENDDEAGLLIPIHFQNKAGICPRFPGGMQWHALLDLGENPEDPIQLLFPDRSPHLAPSHAD